MTQPEEVAPGKTPLSDGEAVQFHLVIPDAGGMTPAEALRFLDQPITPVGNSTQTRNEEQEARP